jgi:hypothetical protein
MTSPSHLLRIRSELLGGGGLGAGGGRIEFQFHEFLLSLLHGGSMFLDGTGLMTFKSIATSRGITE